MFQWCQLSVKVHGPLVFCNAPKIWKLPTCFWSTDTGNGTSTSLVRQKTILMVLEIDCIATVTVIVMQDPWCWISVASISGPKDVGNFHTFVLSKGCFNYKPAPESKGRPCTSSSRIPKVWGHAHWSMTRWGVVRQIIIWLIDKIKEIYF